MAGTKLVGYMGPDEGPFCCSRCRHYEDKAKGSGCNHPEVIADLGAGKSGLAAVSPQGCCNEFQAGEKRSIGALLMGKH